MIDLAKLVEEIVANDPRRRHLASLLKSISDDPSFIAGAVINTGDEIEDIEAMIDFIENGDGVNYSSVLRLSCLFDQERHSEDYEDD